MTSVSTISTVSGLPNKAPVSIRAAPVLWLYGLSGAGKTTLVQHAAEKFRADGRHVVILDGDELRAGVCRGLGYTLEDRFENVRRTAELAGLLSRQGCLVLVALMPPQRAMREEARKIVGEALITVHLCCDRNICAARDVKGLYRQTAAGQLPHFPGSDMAFDASSDNEISLDTGQLPIDECIKRLVLVFNQ